MTEIISNPMTTMLEHQKLIIAKVSHDREMFRKEIVKSFKWLNSYEIISLHRWLKNNYGRQHTNLIRKIFANIAA
jgi:hypothetical protein